jgi:hypothetical protein
LEHDIELVLQIWKELRPHILANDRTDAAEDFIHTLLEHGIDANEIMTFAVDSELKTILRDHADDEHFDDEEEDEDDWIDDMYHEANSWSD